jgi:hypothetical protein
VETHFNTRPIAASVRRSVRARAVSLLGPAAVLSGVAWALIQPYRVTLLHPYHQGFWWLLIEPPLLVAAAGFFFGRLVARPLLTDLEDADATPG